MKKILLMLFLTTFTLNAEVTEKEQEILWNKQIQYVQNMKNLLNSLDEINNKLDKCREFYYQSTKDDKLKNEYLKITKDYSTQLVVTSTLLNQAISGIEVKMKNNKDSVLNGLIKYKDSLDSHLEKEAKRNNNIKIELIKGFEKVQEQYCN